MSGTHHLFTATGRALPLPPAHTPRRSSSVLRLPSRRYDPTIDDVKHVTDGAEGRRSYEAPYGGEFVYKTETERRRSQVVIYDPSRRYSAEGSNKVYGTISTTASSRVSRRSSQIIPRRGPQAAHVAGQENEEDHDDEDVMTGATDLATPLTSHPRSRAVNGAKGRASPAPHRAHGAMTPHEIDDDDDDSDDAPSLNPHGIDTSGRTDPMGPRSRPAQPQRPQQQQREEEGEVPSSRASVSSSVREFRATINPAGSTRKQEAARQARGAAVTPLPLASEAYGEEVETPRMEHHQPPPQPQPRPERRPQGTGEAAPPMSWPSQAGGAPTLGGPQQVRQAAPATPSAASTISRDSTASHPRRQQQQRTPLVQKTPSSSSAAAQPPAPALDIDQPLPAHLYPGGHPRRSPAPGTYQPFTEAALARSPGASDRHNGADGAPPTPRYSRSPRKDYAGGGESPSSHQATPINMESIPQKVRRLSASPDRSPQNSHHNNNSAAMVDDEEAMMMAAVNQYTFPMPASNRRGKRSLSVGGTELLPAFPALQGQLDSLENEKERSYRTIVKFIERQPEAQKRELKALYLEEYKGKEEEFVALLSEAYGEDFDAMKAGVPVADPAPVLSMGGSGGVASRGLDFESASRSKAAPAPADAAVEYPEEEELEQEGEEEALDDADSETYPEDEEEVGLYHDDDDEDDDHEDEAEPEPSPHERAGAGEAEEEEEEMEAEIRTPPVPSGI